MWPIWNDVTPAARAIGMAPVPSPKFTVPVAVSRMPGSALKMVAVKVLPSFGFRLVFGSRVIVGGMLFTWMDVVRDADPTPKMPTARELPRSGLGGLTWFWEMVRDWPLVGLAFLTPTVALA